MSEIDLVSKSETIGVKEQKGLLNTTRQMAGLLTTDEFVTIMTVYSGAIARLLQENEEEQ